MSTKDEAEFLIKARDWLTVAYTRQIPRLTPFLTPFQKQRLEALAKSFDGLELHFHGGFLAAQRCRCLIVPMFEGFQEDDFAIAGFKIDYAKKFNTIEHRQVLGSLMSLQIDRSRIGDILLDENQTAYVAVMEEMAPYLKEHFVSVGSVPIRLKPADLSQIRFHQLMEEFEIMVASQRLDVIVAALLKVSRAQVAEYFKSGWVQLNHQVEQNPSRTCQAVDVLSIKRYGRCQFQRVVRTTKNKKLVLLMGKAT